MSAPFETISPNPRPNVQARRERILEFINRIQQDNPELTISEVIEKVSEAVGLSQRTLYRYIKRNRV